MKTIVFCQLIFLTTFFCQGQSSAIEIDYEYFLLGTLNDYMGRESYKKIDNRIDEYSQNSKPLVFLLDSIFHEKYHDLIISTNKKNGRLELQSRLLAQRMNDFYSYTPSGRGAYIGEADMTTLNLDSLTKTPDFYSTYFDTIYTGRIRNDIFKNDIQRLSFITGAYIRFGGERDSLYFIRIANSISKVRIASEQLKDLKCSNIEYVWNKGHIPTYHTVYFTPTPELQDYLVTVNQILNRFSD
jgi:hypothetical protein